MTDLLQPKPEHKFSFGLWTLGNRGRDPFGDAVRATIPPTQILSMLAEVGAWGVNLHDNDLVPIDATSRERDQIVGLDLIIRSLEAECPAAGAESGGSPSGGPSSGISLRCPRAGIRARPGGSGAPAYPFRARGPFFDGRAPAFSSLHPARSGGSAIPNADGRANWRG